MSTTVGFTKEQLTQLTTALTAQHTESRKLHKLETAAAAVGTCDGTSTVLLRKWLHDLDVTFTECKSDSFMLEIIKNTAREELRVSVHSWDVNTWEAIKKKLQRHIYQPLKI